MCDKNYLLLRPRFEPFADLAGPVPKSRNGGCPFTFLYSNGQRSQSAIPYSARKYLAVPTIMNQRNIHWQPTINKLLLQHSRITTSITRHIAGLLRFGDAQNLEIFVCLEYGLEAE